MFEFLKKKKLSHEEKIEQAYKCYKPEFVGMLFPNGKEQVSNILLSLEKICGFKLEDFDGLGYYHILNIYSDIFIRKNITKSARDHILISLQVKHKDMIKDADTAEKVLQFYEKNSVDPKYVYENYTTENTKAEKIKCAICGKEIDFNEYGLCDECKHKKYEKENNTGEPVGKVEIDEDNLNEMFKKAETEMITRNFDNAKKIFNEYIDYIYKLKEEKQENWLSFNNNVEFALYFNNNRDIEKTYNVNYKMNIVYTYLGSMEFELGNYDKAIEYLNQALQWNPFDFKATMELAETYKAKNDLKKYYSITLDSINLIYTEKDLARYYRNLGYYFIENKEWNLAKAVYLYSLRFENSNNVYQEIQYIVQSTGDDKLPEKETLAEVLKENRIGTYISKDNLRIIDDLYEKTAEEKQLDTNFGKFLTDLRNSYVNR